MLVGELPDVPVELNLTSAQVEQIMRQVAGEEAGGESILSMLLALGGSRDAPVLNDLERYVISVGHGVSRSVLVGLLVLASVPSEGQVGVTALARRLGMHSSTLHRYFRTWVLVGLLEQDIDTQEYHRPR